MMKKLLCTLAVIFIMSCSSDCNINSAKITEYSAEITVLDEKLKTTKSDFLRDLYSSEIKLLKAKIAEEADKCD